MFDHYLNKKNLVQICINTEMIPWLVGRDVNGFVPIGMYHPYKSEFCVPVKKPIPQPCGCNFVLVVIPMRIAGAHGLSIPEKKM
jgi:hypothetical protein